MFTHGQRIIETTTEYVGTVISIYTNSLGNTMLRVNFDAVGTIAAWCEWIPADLVTSK